MKILATLQAVIDSNLVKFATRFKETADIKWLTRYAQEVKLARELSRPGRYEEVRLADFQAILADPELFSGAGEIQEALDNAVITLLLQTYEKLPPAMKAVTGSQQGPARQVLDARLIPDQKQLPAFQEALVSLVRSNGGLRQKDRPVLLARLQGLDVVGSAIERVLTLAAQEAWNLNIWRNPLLLFLPAKEVVEFIKQAAPIRENQGMRVSDLIRALRITIGKYGNEIILKSKELESGLITPTNSKLARNAISTNIRKIAVLDGYLDFLERAKKGLEDLFRSDPKKEWMRYGKAGSPFVTLDPFVQGPKESPASFADLIRPTAEKSDFQVSTVLWDGSIIKITNLKPPQEEIAKLYVGQEMKKPGYADRLADRIADGVAFYKEHSLTARADPTLNKLAVIFTNESESGLMQIRKEILDHLQMAVVPPDEAALEEGKAAVDELTFLAKQTKDPLDAEIRAHEAAQEESFLAAKTAIIKNYEKKATLKGDEYDSRMSSIIDEVIAHEIAPIKPRDRRKFKELVSGGFGGNVAKGPLEIGISKNTIKDFLMLAFPDTQKVLLSRDFEIRYQQNAEALSEWEENHKEEPDPIFTSIADGLRTLRNSEEIKGKLGISESVLRFAQDPSPKVFEDEFAKMVDPLFAKKPEEIKAILGSIPIDSLYAYIAELYAEGNYKKLLCKIACRWSAAVKEGQEAPENIEDYEATAKKIGGEDVADCGMYCKNVNPMAYHEAVRYMAERGSVIKLSKGAGQKAGTNVDGPVKLDTGLALDSIPGAVARWHLEQQFSKVDRKKITSFLTQHATMYGFGAFLRDETRSKLNAELKQNKQESSELETAAKSAGVDFEWDAQQKPRDTKELMEATGAFADPISNLTRSGPKKSSPKMSAQIQPGQRLSPEELTDLKNKPDTPEKALDRMVWANLKISGGYRGIVGEIAKAFENRRQEILDINPEYARDIIKFKSTDERTRDPFVHQGLYAEKEDLTITPQTPKQTVAPVILPAEPVATDPTKEVLPGTKAVLPAVRYKKFVDALGGSVRLLDVALKSPPQTQTGLLAKQISIFQNLVEDAEGMIKRYRAMRARDLELAPDPEPVQKLVDLLNSRIETDSKQIEVNKAREEVRQREVLDETIKGIIASINAFPKWQDEAVATITSSLLSLTKGKTDEVIHPAYIDEAFKKLRDFLASTEKLRSDPARAKELSKEYGPDFQIDTANKLEAEIDRWRSAHFIEEDDAGLTFEKPQRGYQVGGEGAIEPELPEIPTSSSRPQHVQVPALTQTIVRKK